MHLIFLFFAVHFTRLKASTPATFPTRISKERLVENTNYTGRCTTTINGQVKPVATFKLNVEAHSTNIIKRGYYNTSHIGVMIANPNPSATTPSLSSLLLAVLDLHSLEALQQHICIDLVLSSSDCQKGTLIIY